MRGLTIALPKGRLLERSLHLLDASGLPFPDARSNSRRLMFRDRETDSRLILVKPVDVVTYVEHGAADVGIVGEDVLHESGVDVLQPLTLPFGHCRIVVAGTPAQRDANLRLLTNLRVATKYPRLTREHFARRGLSAEIIALSGSIELGPAIGLADLLVDVVETGRTLRENGLVEIETILRCSACVIVNRASQVVKDESVNALLQAVSETIVNSQLSTVNSA
ncbi:MAG: ATP phosphoribosyltransferase [Chloroflexi bacterium]|nr:ATP phosphoribosyltransferase [Chloroflexota bacterium]